MADPHDIDALARLLGESTRILVFTGAGVSTASGIPDYRGPQGVWTTRRPVEYGAFMSSPEARRTYWRQKLEDREAHGDAAPNAVHRAVVDLERAGRLEMVVTQNVDGLHAAAGTSPERLVEIHGTTRQVECQRCGTRVDPEDPFARFAATGEAPDCGCGGPLKPATISFGQGLRAVDIDRAVRAAQRCDLVVSLGSTLTVVPAADIPLAAAQRGVRYVVVNRGATGHDGSRWVTVRIEDDVNAVFPPAVEAALPGREG
jgi:NAD-dependent deacetylase